MTANLKSEQNLQLEMLRTAPPRPPPARGRFAFIINTYNDPIAWPLVKSVIGFGVGVYLARKISEEWVLADAALTSGAKF
ncbi:hypothetical protein M3Y98_00741600 [Aphelenchoides besseyi]|nr:hypothetical protein M3Y98_00741600 [Aphelenchoides besseyi]KAI6211462.1 hypothetical protein M3Y96_00436700 [Aphelenchoides besseyi]